MIGKIHFLCLVGVLLLFSVLTASGQELPLTYYTPESELNPLPSADVRSVYQDRLGYIWMVVYSSGLVRYNGYKNETYTTADGLLVLDVRQVMEDEFGRLWVASEAGLVVSERPLGDYEVGERIRFTSRIGSTELARTAIIENRLVVDARGWIWVGTRESGIIRYRFPGLDSVIADTIQTDIQGEGKNIDVRAIAVRKDSSVCVSVGSGDLLLFSKGSPAYQALSEKDGIHPSHADALYFSRSGALYGGCQDGLVWRLLETGAGRRVETVSTELKSRITCMTEEEDGTFWIASEGSGAERLLPRTDSSVTNEQFRRRLVYTRKNGLLSDNISRIMQDREGNVWIAQVFGVSKLRNNYAAFGNFTAASHSGARPNLPTPSVNAVIPPDYPGASSIMIVATTGGGVALIDDRGRVETIQTDRGLRNNWANGLALDDKSRIWIGTTSGINCLSLDPKFPPPRSLQTGSVSVFDKKGVLAGYRKTTIYSCNRIPLRAGPGSEKASETIWFSGYQNLYCFADENWFVFRTPAGVPATFLDGVTIDGEGNLWIGTRDKGLYRTITPLTVASLSELQSRVELEPQGGSEIFGREIVAPVFKSVWNESNGAPSNQIETLLWKGGLLWVGTPDGLIALKTDPLEVKAQLTMADGLRGNDVTSMAFSPVTGSLWIGTNGGLAEIDPVRRRPIRTITKQNGLIDNEVWFYGSVTAGGDGTIYFGTSKGLSLYTPHLDKKNTQPPIVRLQQVSFSEDNTGDNEVSFEYAALSYANEREVRYRTRLVGYDRDWSPDKTEVKIRYTNLPAFLFSKEYTFEVLAANNDGLRTEAPLAFTFSVRPPWWFRWWSFLLNVGFLVLVANGFFHYRTRELERRSRALEKIVEERTHEILIRAEENRLQAEELAETNAELEEKNREIIKTQEQLIMQEKLASLGALTAGIAHEIKNPLNFVNNFAELSIDLTKELREDISNQKARLDSDTLADIEEVLDNLEHNAVKINEHGKRADVIVRGMLLHSRGKSGERIPTDINVLLDENVNLGYIGLRAQDPNFNIEIDTDYDRSIGQIEVVPTDLSRVFLNIVNNACYAANERKKESLDGFSPKLSVFTKNLGDKVEIRIRDNGKGIPPEIRDRIFEPFFTTKPTGKGTGLGLSLSYDIVVKQHHGEIKVDTQVGEYTEFIIQLPK